VALVSTLTQPETNKVEQRDDAPAQSTGPADPLAQPPRQSSAGIEVGQLLGGHYQVISRLGSGGMGVVYRVKQIFLNTELALKTVDKHHLSDIAVRRFQQEARTAFALDHPNIIKVHDFGLLDDQTPFFVMEIAEGQTLAERLKQAGPLTVPEALAIFVQVCFGLAYAHDHGVVHRDIKPSNIILLTDMQSGKVQNVKIVDFGIAKFADHQDGEIQSLTRTGEVVGSPLYMSPEQCSGEHVDHRSDIYSLGCVLFESLTGMPPFVADNPLTTMLCHQNEIAPTLKEATLGTEFPRALEYIVATMLAKKPDSRYQSLGVLAHHLTALERGDSGQIPGKTSAQTSKHKAPEKISMRIVTFSGLILVVAMASMLATYFSICVYHEWQHRMALERAPLDANPNSDILLSHAETKAIVEDYLEKPDDLAKKLAQPSKDNILRERDVMVSAKSLRAISQASWIEYIDFIDSHLSNKDLGLLSKLHLRRIDLTWSNFDDDGAKALSACKSLERVHADSTHITDAGAVDILKLPNLQGFLLSQTKITDRSLTEIAKHNNLICLALDSVSQITSAGIAKLESNAKLQELHLDHTQVDDAALKHLAAISSLKSIDLSDSKVSVSGVKTLCQSIKSLREVYIGRCSDIGPHDLESLKKEFGEIRFFNRSMTDREE
jgi:serine/threonine protein kinase